MKIYVDVGVKDTKFCDMKTEAYKNSMLFTLLQKE